MLRIRSQVTLEFVAFALVATVIIGLNAWFVTYQVTQSQHNFCAIVNTRSNQPPVPAAHPSQQYLNYVRQVTNEYKALKGKLGC